MQFLVLGSQILVMELKKKTKQQNHNQTKNNKKFSRKKTPRIVSKFYNITKLNQKVFVYSIKDNLIIVL